MAIVRCCWRRWWTQIAFAEPAIGPPTGPTSGRPPGAVAWTESTKLTVKPSKTSMSIHWSVMPGNVYAATLRGNQIQPMFSDPDKYGRGTSFSFPAFYAGQFSKVYTNSPAGLFFKGDAGIPDAMWNAKKANFAPRVGLVWNPHGDGRDTIRVGGAILYDVVETWFNERETTNAPIGTNIDTPNPVGGFSDPWKGYAGGNPFPQN